MQRPPEKPSAAMWWATTTSTAPNWTTSSRWPGTGPRRSRRSRRGQLNDPARLGLAHCARRQARNYAIGRAGPAGTRALDRRVDRAQRLVPRRPGRCTAGRERLDVERHRVSRTATGMLYTAESGSNWFRNHIAAARTTAECAPAAAARPAPYGRRRCATRPRARVPRPSRPRTARRTGTAVSSAAPSRATTWVASSELPPRAKKSSSRPTRSTPEHLGEDARDNLLHRRHRSTELPMLERPAPAAPCGPACRLR